MIHLFKGLVQIRRISEKSLAIELCGYQQDLTSITFITNLLGMPVVIVTGASRGMNCIYFYVKKGVYLNW